jgi:hypothetical protein
MITVTVSEPDAMCEIAVRVSQSLGAYVAFAFRFSMSDGRRYTDALTLIIGCKNLSAIGTLVERTTNYTMLLHLPDGYTPELVRDALASKIKTLPEMLRASLTWDQGRRCGTASVAGRSP